MIMQIERINNYEDKRFPRKILNQHGAFIIDGNMPCGVEITGADTAVVHCSKEEYYGEIAETFRFYAGHICKFFDGNGKSVAEFPSVQIFDVRLGDIQPSQFYVDEDKFSAVKSFIKSNNDIIIPLQKSGKKFVSLDGHTRLALAATRGYKTVKGFIARDIQIQGFVKEAQKRGIYSPFDLKIISHTDYDILWNKFCDDFFADGNAEKTD